MVSENKTKSMTLRRKFRVEARKTRLDKPELTPQGRKETEGHRQGSTMVLTSNALAFLQSWPFL